MTSRSSRYTKGMSKLGNLKLLLVVPSLMLLLAFSSPHCTYTNNPLSEKKQGFVDLELVGRW